MYNDIECRIYCTEKVAISNENIKTDARVTEETITLFTSIPLQYVYLQSHLMALIVVIVLTIDQEYSIRDSNPRLSVPQANTLRPWVKIPYA